MGSLFNRGDKRMRNVLRGIALLLLLTATTTLWAKDRLLPNEASTHVSATRTVDLADGQRVTLTGTFNSLTGAPVEVQGGFEGERIAATDREALVRFIGEHPAQFRITPSDLEVLTSGTVRHKSYLTALQKVDGRPVLGTRVQLRVHTNGRILLWGADVVDGTDAHWQASLTSDDAANALKTALEAPTAVVVSTKEMWYRRGAEFRPAYAVQLARPDGLKQPNGLVDAQTGAVIATHEGIWDATISGHLQGSILPFNPSTPAELRPLANATVRLDVPATAILTDSAGAFEVDNLTAGDYPVHFWLEGPYVSVQNVQIDVNNFDITPNPFHCDSLCVAPDTVDFVIAPGVDSITQAAVNTWAHVSRVRDWWAGMDPMLDIINQTIYIFPDQTDPNLAYNAGYLAPMPPIIPVPLIIFGAGGGEFSNFAHVSDVIYHEYTHAVTSQFYPGDSQSGFTPMEAAMHEGFSDYFACTITENPLLGQGMFVGYPDSAFRSLLNDHIYPDDWEGEGHWDGQIISAAMWEARVALGAAVVDTLFHYACYSSPPDYDSYFQEVLVEDDDDGDLTNGTPHELELWTAFHRHGIGPDSIVHPDAVELPPVAALPQSPRLIGLYPNPFNPTTTVEYALPQTATVTFTVHDVLGREVERVVRAHMSAGEHREAFDLSKAASGVYFIGMQSGSHVETAKAMLLK
jgi:hypothetical protein